MSDLQRVGPVFGGSGTAAPFTSGLSGAQRVADGHGRYMDAVLSGRCFVACSQALATLQTGLTTAQTGLGIYNPAGSGKRLALWSASCGFVVAQPTAAAVFGLCANTTVQQAAPTSQTAAVTRNLLLGASQTSSASAIIAGTLAAAPVAVATLGIAYTGAITVATMAPAFFRDFAGALVVEQGSYLGFFASVAPAATTFWGELVWEEIPVLA